MESRYGIAACGRGTRAFVKANLRPPSPATGTRGIETGDGALSDELDLLSDVLEFRRKYDRHSAVMERLMERYGEEMLGLLAGDF